MRKSSAIILSLVALLTACNKKATGDFFTKDRKANKLTASQRAAIEAQNDFGYVIAHYKVVGGTYNQQPNGSWTLDTTSVSTLEGFLWSGARFDNVDGISQVMVRRQLGTTYDPTQLEILINIQRENGVYVFANGPIAAYSQNASELFKQLHDSFFDWNVTFFSGAHHYLLSVSQPNFMPTAMLEATTKKNLFAKVTSGALSTYKYTGSEMFRYTIGDSEFGISKLNMVFNNHRLMSYEVGYGLSKLMTPTSKNVILTTVETTQVTYANL